MSTFRVNPDNPDALSGRLFPLPDVTAEGLALIPDGSDGVILDWGAGTIECGTMTEVERTHLIEALRVQPEARRQELFMLYLPPLVTPNTAIMTALGKHGFGRESGVYRAIQSGELTPAEFAAIVMDVASEAQKEVLPS